MMGARRQTEDLRFQVHEKFYELQKGAELDVDVCILENVPEYGPEIIQARFPKPKYEMQCVRVDPRIFGEGCSRARLYAVVYKTEKFRWDPQMGLAQFLDMLKMRPCMNAQSYFYMSLPESPLTRSQAD